MKYLLLVVFVIVGVSARNWLKPSAKLIEADRKASQSSCQYAALDMGTREDIWLNKDLSMFMYDYVLQDPSRDQNDKRVFGDSDKE